LRCDRFWCIKINLHDVRRPSERPLLPVWTVNGNLALVAERYPILCINSKPWMVLDVGGHDDKTQIRQLDNPMPKLPRVNSIPFDKLLIRPSFWLPFKLEGDALSGRKHCHPRSEQVLLGSPNQRIDKP